MSSYAARRCPTHACKMTLLFQHYVCDVCEPPKLAKLVTTPSTIAEALANIDWGWLCMPPLRRNHRYGIVQQSSSHMSNMHAAELVLAFVPQDPKLVVYILKHRHIPDQLPKPLHVDPSTMLDLEILAVPGPKSGVRLDGHLLGTHLIFIAEEID